MFFESENSNDMEGRQENFVKTVVMNISPLSLLEQESVYSFLCISLSFFG